MAEHCKFYRCDRMIEKDGYCFLHKMYAGSAASTSVEPKTIEKKSTGTQSQKKR